MANKAEVSAILALVSNLPNCPLTGARDHDALVVETYFLVLKDFSFEHLKAAIAQYLGAGTFFPTPGNLREAALDLVLSARGIPTAAEAWGNVQDAEKYLEPAYCRIGWELRQSALDANAEQDGAKYNQSIHEQIIHEQTCRQCKPGGFQEVYNHPVVAEAVRRLGGRDALLTDNPAADRARFIEAYNEIVSRERKEASRIPEVADFIEQERNRLALSAPSESIKQLTAKMETK